MGRSQGKLSKGRVISRQDKTSKVIDNFTATEKEAYDFACLVEEKIYLLNSLKDNKSEYEQTKNDLIDLAGNLNSQQIITDILTRFKKTAKISDKQIQLILKLKKQAEEQKVQRARLPKPSSVPFSKEPVDVEGEVLSIKLRDRDPYYGEFVITVVDDRGFKVWGPMTNKHAYKINPDGTKTALMKKGDRVIFKAKLKPSDRDETFGFFKDPEF